MMNATGLHQHTHTDVLTCEHIWRRGALCCVRACLQRRSPNEGCEQVSPGNRSNITPRPCLRKLRLLEAVGAVRGDRQVVMHICLSNGALSREEHVSADDTRSSAGEQLGVAW